MTNGETYGEATRLLSYLVPDDYESYIRFFINQTNTHIVNAKNEGWEFIKTYEQSSDSWLFTLSNHVGVFAGHKLIAQANRRNPINYAEGVIPSDYNVNFDNDSVCFVCGTRRETVQYFFLNEFDVPVMVGKTCLPRFFEAQGVYATVAKGTASRAESYFRITMSYPIGKRLADFRLEERPDTVHLIAAALYSEKQSRKVGSAAYAIMNKVTSPASMGADGWLPAIEELTLSAAIIKQWAAEEMPVTDVRSASIKRAAQRPYNSRRAGGTLVDMVTHYRLHANAERAIAAGLPVTGAGYVPGFVGEVGQRVKFRGGLLESKKQTVYDSTAITVRAPSGQKVTWYAKTQKAQRSVQTLDEGTLVDFVGTVVNQKTFRNVDETVMVRGAVTRAS